MKLINFTKDVIRLHDTRGVLVEVPPDPRHVGVVAIGEHTTVEDEAGRRFSLNVRYVKEVKGLPEPNGEAIYIVPIEVAMALQTTREDVVFAAEEAEVRDAEGRLQRITHLRRIIAHLS